MHQCQRNTLTWSGRPRVPQQWESGSCSLDRWGCCSCSAPPAVVAFIACFNPLKPHAKACWLIWEQSPAITHASHSLNVRDKLIIYYFTSCLRHQSDKSRPDLHSYNLTYQDSSVVMSYEIRCQLIWVFEFAFKKKKWASWNQVTNFRCFKLSASVHWLECSHVGKLSLLPEWMLLFFQCENRNGRLKGTFKSRLVPQCMSEAAVDVITNDSKGNSPDINVGVN